MDAWRSEALINSEGDLQLTIHVDLGDDQDFRYVWSIDPDFAPDDCLENEDGELYRAFSDGSSWVQEWSEDEDGNLVYYLNAGSYQVDPTDSENSWYLSDDMVAGYSHAKFAAEEFSSHPGEYGHYDLDGSPLAWGTDALSGGTLAGGFLGVESTVTRAASDLPERTTTSTGTSSTRPTSRASAQPSRVRSVPTSMAAATS